MSLTCQSIHDVTLADLYQVLPEKPLYGTTGNNDNPNIGWLLSPKPYGLTPNQLNSLHLIGPCLHRFAQATDLLYKTSLKDENWSWITALFHAGKPQHLINFSQMNRFKGQLPLVMRPDLLVTEKGFSLCEIDAVPGGIGFTAALYQAYRTFGFNLAGIPEGIPQAFLRMMLQAAPANIDNPMVAIVVSDEAADYRQEMEWLVQAMQDIYPDIAVIHPREITLEHNRLGYLDAGSVFKPIDMIYRFFELFDLMNIPQIELIQYALKKGLVTCTPPFKPHLEEKMVLALTHYPYLEKFWVDAMGEEDFHRMKALVPETWILDPAPVPPQAQIIPPLRFADKALRDFNGLGTLTQKQRELVVKPSGFSPLAWGSRGVKMGHDLSQDIWQKSLEEAFSQFPTTPSILQRFENTKVEPYQYFKPQTGEITEGQGRTRLCPYYFVLDGKPELVGALATTCPKEKKIIHGMSEGVMRPACVMQ